MAFDIRPTLQALQSVLKQDGYFAQVFIGEPKSPPVDQMTAAIQMMEILPTQVTLGTDIEVHTLQVRVYRNAMGEANAGGGPDEAIEYETAQAVSKVLSDLAGGFTLGGKVRAVDWNGEEGGLKVAAKWGHLDVGGTMFRVADITVPLIVDDAVTFVA